MMLVLLALGIQFANSADNERKTFKPGKAIPPPAQATGPQTPATAVPPVAPPPAVPPQQEKPKEPDPIELQPYTPKGLTFFMMSNRMGEMEPCGCVKNQLGGMQYEATLLQAVAHEQGVRADAGGWGVSNANPEARMETMFILKGMGEVMDYDAINVTGVEAGMGSKFFDEIKTKYPKAHERLVSANVMLVSEPTKQAFAPYRIVEKKLPDGTAVRVAITGVSAQPVTPAVGGAMGNKPAAPDYIAIDLVNALDPIMKELKDKADVITVLGFGSFQEMERAAKAYPEIDIIVSSSPTPDYNAKVQSVGTTYVYGSFTNLGKLLGRVDLVKDATSGNWAPTSTPLWLNVSPKIIQPVQQLVDVLGEYKNMTKDLFLPVPPNLKVLYAGAQNCIECHQPAFETWKTSRHAHAMQTLINKDSQYNPECIKCHVTGFKNENGFYNVRDTNHMANVQCEVCHGPAYEHVTHERLIKNKTIEAMAAEQRETYLAEAKKLVPPKEVPETTCIQCHQGENDPHWNYEKKIVWVNHKPVPQEVLDALAAENAAKAQEAH